MKKFKDAGFIDYKVRDQDLKSAVPFLLSTPDSFRLLISRRLTSDTGIGAAESVMLRYERRSTQTRRT